MNLTGETNFINQQLILLKIKFLNSIFTENKDIYTKRPDKFCLAFLVFMTSIQGLIFSQKIIAPDCNLYPATLVDSLSDEVRENSGLVWYWQKLWTFNDSGGDPEIYALDSKSGKIIQTVVFVNANNFDWEDIAQDSSFIYTSDSGNNFNFRRRLTIYKVKKRRIPRERKLAYVSAFKIHYTYEGRKDFSFNMGKTSFDCESLFAMGDSLYVLTKDWKNKVTELYSLSKIKHRQVARCVGRFNSKGLITGADISPDGKTVILCGITGGIPFIWVLQNFQGCNIFSGTTRRFLFPGLKGIQMEGIAFSDNHHIFLSAEKTSVPARLYSLDLP